MRRAFRRFTRRHAPRYTKVSFFTGQTLLSDMKRIGIIFHPLKDAACSLARDLTEFLRERHLSVWLCSAWEWEKACPQVDGSDLVVTIGGDGTILRAAQADSDRRD